MYPSSISKLDPNRTKPIQQNILAGTVVDRDMTNHKFFGNYFTLN